MDVCEAGGYQAKSLKVRLVTQAKSIQQEVAQGLHTATQCDAPPAAAGQKVEYLIFIYIILTVLCLLRTEVKV